MYRIIPFCLLLLLAACGTTGSVKVAISVPTTTSFIFSDRRPDTQRISRAPTQSDSESYYGDDVVSPPAPDVLRAVLERRQAVAFRGKTITLTDLVISVKDPAVSVDGERLRTAASSVPGGAAAAPLAGLLILGIERIRSQKWVYVRIRGLVGDAEFSAYRNDSYSGRVTEENIQTTLMAVIEAAANDAEQLASKN